MMALSSWCLHSAPFRLVHPLAPHTKTAANTGALTAANTTDTLAAAHSGTLDTAVAAGSIHFVHPFATHTDLSADTGTLAAAQTEALDTAVTAE